MRLYKKAITGLVAACLATTAVACKQADPEITKTEALSFPTDVTALESSLSSRLGEFEDTFNSGQISRLLDFTPPKILTKILIDTNVTRVELNAQIDMVWEQTLQVVGIGAFDLDKTIHPVKFLADGRPYKILPTSTVMTVKANDSEVISKSETLALIENGEWYILRLDDPSQIKIFREAYPGFDDVDVMAPVLIVDGEELTP